MLTELAELAVLMRNRRLPLERLRQLQDRRLCAVVRHAYDAVPYYRDLFTAARLAPGDIRSVDDLRHIPITTKAAMKSAGLPRLVAHGSDLSACTRSRTNGTEGLLFDSWHDRTEARTRRLLGFRRLREAGYGPRDRLVVLGPSFHPPPRPHHRLGFFRTSHLPASRPVPDYVSLLRQVRPTILKAWPTVLMMLRGDVSGPFAEVAQPRAVFTSSEVCPESIRRWIRNNMRAEPFELYVASEVGEIAWECRAHQGLHVNADHVLVECLDQCGQPCAPGESGSVVVTSLYGGTMPFLRYRLGDEAAPIAGPCPCGCAFPRMSVPAGRVNDLIRLPSGAVMPCTRVLFGLFGEDDIQQLRFIQDDHDRFRLLLVPSAAFRPARLAHFRAVVLESLGEPVAVSVEAVESIPSEPGKHRWFVSKLPREEVSA
jgi:phenylacetate-CoA ligase